MSSHEEADRALAWTLHVELASRITSVELAPGEGLLSEALNSVYSVFTTARTALAAHPPGANGGPDSVHNVVFRLMNQGIRPFLTRWHPHLVAFGETRPPGMAGFHHEHTWEYNAQFRAELADLQVLLRDVARHLAEIANATSLLTTTGGEH